MQLGKLALSSSKTLILTILKFVFFGTLTAWILLGFLIPEMRENFQIVQGPLEGAGIAGFLVLLAFWKEVLVFALFLLGFPFIYFIFGKKQALKKITYQAIITKNPTIESLIEKLIDKILESKTKLDAKELIKKITGENKLLNKIIGFLAKKVINEETLEYIETIKSTNSTNQSETKQKIKEKILDTINERFKPSSATFRSLFGIQVAIFILCKWFVL